jgi:hypothetical protein
MPFFGVPRCSGVASMLRAPAIVAGAATAMQPLRGSLTFTAAFSKRVEEMGGGFVNQRSERAVTVLPPRMPASPAEQKAKVPGDFIR